MLKSKTLILSAIIIIISGFLNAPEAVRIMINLVFGVLVFILSVMIFRDSKSVSPLLSILAGIYLFTSAFINGITSNNSSYLFNNLITGLFINNASTICLLNYLKSQNKNRRKFRNSL